MTFEHTNLKEVQASQGFGDRPAIADGPYNLEIVKAGIKEYTVGVGKKNAGTKGELVDFQFAIVDDANFSGRRIFQPGVFPGGAGDKQLRLLMDATGIVQTSTVPEWLAELVASKARFNGPVVNYQDTYLGEPKEKTKVDLWKVSPYQG